MSVLSRHRGLTVVATAAVAALAWTGWVAVTASGVAADAAELRRSVDVLRTDLEPDALLRGEASELTAAAERADELLDRLDHPLLAPAGALPVLGRQLDAARHQLAAGRDLLETVDDLATAAAAPLDALDDPGARVGALRTLADRLDDATARLAAVELGPADGLVGPLHRGRADLSASLDRATELTRDTADDLHLAADLLAGPGNYLVLAANNAQMQNGSGMFLSAGVLEVADGRLDLGRMRSVTRLDLPDPAVTLPASLGERWGWLDPNRDWRHLGLSPRFPETAELAADMWEATTGQVVDGVIAVDTIFVASLIDRTGPIEVDGIVLDGETALEELLNGQYVRAFGDGSTVEDDPRPAWKRFAEAQTGRRELLARVADVVMRDALTSLDVDDLLALHDTARNRHVMVWTRDPSVTPLVDELGLDGDLSPDSLMLSLVNRSGVKLDWFLRTHATVEVTEGIETDEVAVHLRIRNVAPDTGQPAYVVGPYPDSGLEAGSYLGVATLTLPADATRGRVDGVDALAVVGAEGAHNRVVGSWVEVPRGGDVELTFRFEVPADRDAVVIEPSARVSPTRWSRPDGGDVRDDAARRLSW